MAKIRIPSCWGRVLPLLGMVVCGVSSAIAGSLEGTASYRERISLPPDAVFEAQLQDVSLADAPPWCSAVC